MLFIFWPTRHFACKDWDSTSLFSLTPFGVSSQLRPSWLLTQSVPSLPARRYFTSPFVLLGSHLLEGTTIKSMGGVLVSSSGRSCNLSEGIFSLFCKFPQKKRALLKERQFVLKFPGIQQAHSSQDLPAMLNNNLWRMHLALKVCSGTVRSKHLETPAQSTLSLLEKIWLEILAIYGFGLVHLVLGFGETCWEMKSCLYQK